MSLLKGISILVIINSLITNSNLSIVFHDYDKLHFRYIFLTVIAFVVYIVCDFIQHYQKGDFKKFIEMFKGYAEQIDK